MKQVKPNAWNGHFAIVEYDTETGAERRQEITDEEWTGEASRVVAHRAAMFTGTRPHHADKSGNTIPANFPAGYEERNGLYFKTDADGKVTEIRNLFGCDITARADINLLFGCKTKGDRK